MGSRTEARLDLAFDRRGRRTVVTRRLYTWPYTVGRSFYDDQDAPGMATVVVQSGSGSINAGDTLRQCLRAGPGARIRVAGQGAVSVNRAAGGQGATELTRLEVDAAGWLENLPQPRVLLPGAALTQRLHMDVDPRGTALSVDAFVLHPALTEVRHYCGETQVTRGGAVVARERIRFTFPGPSGSMIAPRAHAVLLLVAEHCDVGRASEGWRSWNASTGSAAVYGAVSALPFDAGLVVRVAASDGQLLRAAVGAALPLLRASAGTTAPWSAA